MEFGEFIKAEGGVRKGGERLLSYFHAPAIERVGRRRVAALLGEREHLAEGVKGRRMIRAERFLEHRESPQSELPGSGDVAEGVAEECE